MNNRNNEIELIDILNILLKRKWFIIISTLGIIIIAAITSFLLPKKWDVSTVFIPSKLLTQTAEGKLEEIVFTDPIQVVGQIQEGSYTNLIINELNLDPSQYPRLRTTNIQNTNLIRISIREREIEKAKSILSSLLIHLKRDLDAKSEIETKGIDSQIESKKNAIEHKKLVIKDNQSEIKMNQIQKNKKNQEITAAENKLLISEEREKNIMEEMKNVKDRIEKLEEQQRQALAENKEGSEILGLLLYSNEVQTNLRYYNTLDSNLSSEKVHQENLALEIKEANEELKQLDTQIEKWKNEIDKVNNDIANIQNDINLLIDRKGRIDPTQVVKEPTPSLNPVSPQKKLIVLLSFLSGLVFFSLLAFFLEYIERQKTR